MIALGTNFPFANLVYRSHDFKFVSIDIDAANFGRHHYLDLGILSDSGSFLQKALERSATVAPRPFYQASVAAMKDWKSYLERLMQKMDGSLEFEQVYREINRISDANAVYGIDVGDNIINSFRF